MKINSDLLTAINEYSISTNNSYSCNFLNGETIFYNIDGENVYPIICSKNLSDYKHIEITYSPPRTYGIFTMRFDTSIAFSKGINLFGIGGSSAKDRSYMHYGFYSLSENKINFTDTIYPQFQIMYSTGAITVLTNSSMKIFKIIGYKY